MKRCTCDVCVLDVLTNAGYGAEEAMHVAWEFTCFPMDCDIASEQAREFVKDPATYAARWYAGMDAAEAEGLL